MQEYRWIFRDKTALTIGTDRGRFQTDRDAIDCAVRSLNERPAASVMEVWRGRALISRNVRTGSESSGPDSSDH